MIALWAVRVGWHLREGRRGQGTALMAAGTVVFVARLAAWVLW